MQNWRIDLSWNGARYCGWQRQPNAVSIQSRVEEALQSLFSGERIIACAAGRTDSGVHALQQIVSFEASQERSEDSVMRGLNALLPSDIACTFAQKMPTHFSARNSSKRKMYRYRILNRKVRCPVRSGFVWHIKEILDRERFLLEAKSFVGTHDFQSFRAARCSGKSSIRTIEKVNVRFVEDEILFEVIGKGVLRHQVRIMVGTLMELARKKFDTRSVRTIVEKRNRQSAGVTAPSYGLCLVWTELDSAFKT